MLCENCGKNSATTHIHTVINGVSTEKNLCAQCAHELGFSNNTLGSMLASMFSDFTENQIENQKHCKVCGATFSEIAKTGKLGCSACYDTFYEELLPYLKRVHGSVNHIGKIPNKAPLVIKKSNANIENLKLELSKLVAAEKFEEAAVIRDKIREEEAKNNV